MAHRMKQHMKKAPSQGIDKEISAISAVYEALKYLEPEAQKRVLEYVIEKLSIHVTAETIAPSSDTPTAHHVPNESSSAEPPEKTSPEELEGVSPVAQKWMRRNGLSTDRLSSIFSLGVDEIDVVAKTVPGKSMRERMHSVVLLKGIAAYLSTGAPRFGHEQLKEACLHYDAYDATNFARYLKAFAAEVSGSKDSDYTLTARGLAAATDLLKQMTQQQSAA
jgi:hypothetical protein